MDKKASVFILRDYENPKTRRGSIWGDWPYQLAFKLDGSCPLPAPLVSSSEEYFLLLKSHKLKKERERETGFRTIERRH